MEGNQKEIKKVEELFVKLLSQQFKLLKNKKIDHKKVQ